MTKGTAAKFFFYFFHRILISHSAPTIPTLPPSPPITRCGGGGGAWYAILSTLDHWASRMEKKQGRPRFRDATSWDKKVKTS